MKKKWIILLLLSGLLGTVYGQEIFKLKDVKVGMEGTGRTIFKGSAVETFSFRVLGFVEKFVPNRDLIIVELKNPVLEQSGVIAGMSGSPLYIDGRIMGAVAYGFDFSKKPIAGVTPIEYILETENYDAMNYSVDISNIRMEFDQQNLQHIADLVRAELVKRSNFSPKAEISPIKLIGSSRGIANSALASLRQVFTPISSLKVKTQVNTRRPAAEMFQIQPADAASVPLIRGDFEYSSSGTVSFVKGKKVFLFGHPFFNLGRVNFPLHKAEVVSVVPSFKNSFRLTASRNMIGTVVQDRFSAISADLGTSPYMIPMKVFLKKRNRKFAIEMVDHPLLTPALTSVAMENIFNSEYQQYGFHSIQVKGRIFVENEKNIILDDLYSGTSSFAEFSNLLLAIQFFILNNPEKRVKIQKLDFEITGSEIVRRAGLENVIVNKYSFYPGERMNFKLFFRNERGNRVMEESSFKAPGLKPGAVFYVLVGDKNEMVKFDSKNIKSTYFPMKLNSLIRAINNMRRNNRMYFKIMTPVSGLFIKGYEYSHLPDSMRNLFVYHSSSKNQSEIQYSTLMEYQLPLPAVIHGKKLFKFRIRER